jgi:predicted type IV restriction endonuclease
MSKTFDDARDEIFKLCKYFKTNQQQFMSPGIKEAHVRQSLIDPMFEALGWDVSNRDRIAPQYREVVPEDSLEVEGQRKAPDYAFRIGTLPKFFAEAKKCAVNISSPPLANFGVANNLQRRGAARLAE